MLVCLCVRVCVWCAVAGLLEERSTFVFDFSFRSARFDVQECSSRGKARQEPRYRVSSTCVPQMYYTYVAKQGEHCSQNKLLLQCSHFSVQLISSASTNPHRTLLSRSPCVYICTRMCVCVYLALYKHLSHRPKNNTAIQQQQQQPQNAKLHCKVVAAVAVCCLRSLIASNCRLSAASTLLTYIHTNRLAHTHTHTYCTRLRKCPP